MITIEALRARLNQTGLSPVVLSGVGAAGAVVAPGLGAKVLAAGVDDENLFWVPTNIDAGAWCVGGQRTWLAPELGKGGFFGSGESAWRVPAELDPGRYAPVRRRRGPAEGGGRAGKTRGQRAGDKGGAQGGARPGERVCAFRCQMHLERSDGAIVRVALVREISLLGPPTGLGIAFQQLQVRSTLINRGRSRLRREAGLWNILQVPSESDGTILVPLRAGAENATPRRNFGELPGGWLRRDRGLLALRARAGQRWKVGFPADRIHRSAAYLRRSRTGPAWTLVVQRCRLQPSGTYLDKPPQTVYGNGDALQLYNHFDAGLPFSELECHAPARVLLPGDRQSATVDYFLAKGRLEELLEAAANLLREAVHPGLLFM